MATIDAKVNMSLDEIIKLEKKEKKKKANAANGKTTTKRNRGTVRGRSGLRGRGTRVKRNIGTLKTEQKWQRGQNSSARGAFAKKKFNKNGGLTRSQSNISLNQNQKTTARGNLNRRGRGNRFGLTRSRSRSNLTFTRGGLFTNNKTTLKRASSLSSIRDPTSVYSRLGYQSPAQIAYRNRVKRAKQLLLQRQNQRLNMQNQYRQMMQAGKPSLSLQSRPLERRQQILTSQRRFTTGSLRSDQIARAQRRAQYEQKLMRINAARTTSSNVNFTCTLGNEYTPNEHSMGLIQSRNGRSMNNLRQLPRGRSPFRQSVQNLSMVGRSSVFGRQRSRSRSRSRSRTRNVAMSDSGTEVDDRTFSEVMYSLSGNLGVTGRTLNDRFSF